MSARSTILDVSVFTIGGTDFLGSYKDAEYRVNVAEDDGKPASRAGASAQPVKRSAVLRTTAMSVISAPAKVTNLHLDALSVGGVAMKANVRGGSFSGTMQHDEGSGDDDEWAFPNFVGKDYGANLQLAVPATFDATIEALLHAADADGLDVVFIVTLNGVAIEVPMLITDCAHLFREGAIQMLDATLAGRSPDSGNYPTAPTGTTTILEKAFNAPQTALAVALTNKAGIGLGRARTGNFLFSSFGFDFNDQAVVKTTYEFASQGAVTSAIT